MDEYITLAEALQKEQEIYERLQMRRRQAREAEAAYWRELYECDDPPARPACPPARPPCMRMRRENDQRLHRHDDLQHTLATGQTRARDAGSADRQP